MGALFGEDRLKVNRFGFVIFGGMISLSLIFLLCGAWAEEPKERLVLSLGQLIDMAIAKSPEMSEIQSEIEGTKSDLDQVKSAYYPQVEHRDKSRGRMTSSGVRSHSFLTEFAHGRDSRSTAVAVGRLT